MVDDPREYDKDIEVVVDGRSRRRLGIDTDRGTVTRFVVQLEYRTDPLEDEWATVVRYDHDSEGSDEATHDVTEEGVHIDVYRNNEKVDTHELTPPMPSNHAVKYAEDHLKEHLEGYIQRFELWHGINRNDP